MHHKETQLLAQLSVVTLLGLFHHGDVSLQLLFLRKCSSVDTGQHLIVLVASPVSACQAHDLESLAYVFGTLKVRSCAQIHELTLLVKADFRILWKVLDQLYLVGLALLLHKCDSLLAGLGEAHDLQVLLDDLLHLGLDLLKVVGGQRSLKIHIVVEAVGHGRSDGQLYGRVQTLYSLCHHVACGVTQYRQSLLILQSQDVQVTILIDHGSQVYNLAVYLACYGHARQAFA